MFGNFFFCSCSRHSLCRRAALPLFFQRRVSGVGQSGEASRLTNPVASLLSKLRFSIRVSFFFSTPNSFSGLYTAFFGLHFLFLFEMYRLPGRESRERLGMAFGATATAASAVRGARVPLGRIGTPRRLGAHSSPAPRLIPREFAAAVFKAAPLGFAARAACAVSSVGQ